MIEKDHIGDVLLKSDWKRKAAKFTGGYRGFDRKIMKMKSSWDVVEGMLNGSAKKKRK